MLIRVARPHGQLVLDEDTVQVERGAPAFVAVDPELHLGKVARRVGGRGRLVDGAGGVAQTENIGVWPAAHLKRVHPERIDRHATGHRDIVERNVGAADAANAVGVVRIEAHLVDHCARAVSIELRVGSGALGARHVVEHVVNIEHREVAHLLLGHHSDRLAQILDLRIQARAGHRVRGEIALVVGDDLKGRERDDFFCGRFRGRLGRDRHGRLLGGLHRRDLVRIEFAVSVSIVFAQRRGVERWRDRSRLRLSGGGSEEQPAEESEPGETGAGRCKRGFHGGSRGFSAPHFKRRKKRILHRRAVHPSLLLRALSTNGQQAVGDHPRFGSVFPSRHSPVSKISC